MLGPDRDDLKKKFKMQNHKRRKTGLPTEDNPFFARWSGFMKA